MKSVRTGPVNSNPDANPDTLILRARRIYERHGYSRRWISKRLGGVSARQDLVAEWHRRGARDSEQFRVLTNTLIRHAFGMDVEEYRRFKGLHGTHENLRDHMSDLELALTSLGETTAVALHQSRNSNSFEQLEADTGDAGDIVAAARNQIEVLSAHRVVQPGRHVWIDPAGSHLPGNELAKREADMHNPDFSPSMRSVA